MLNLVRNENMKIYLRVRTWVLVGILMAFCLLAALISHNEKSSTGHPRIDWKTELQQNIQSMERELQSEETPGPLKKRLIEQLAVSRYQLDHHIPPTEATMWGSVQKQAWLVTLATLFTVIVAADVVAAEFTWGTIKLLLIRPSSRAKILLSKYISTMLFALFLLVILFAGSVLMNGVLSGFTGWSAPVLSIDEAGAVRESSAAGTVLAAYGLKMIELIMVVTLAFMISSVFRSSVLSVGVSMFLMLTGQLLTMLLLRWEWGKYFLFANTDLTPYLAGQPLAEGMTLGFSVSVLAVYFVVFNALSWLVFTRRDVAA
ncbi:ABC transporter permease [Paenibacillus chartarius]|uniref:ABC transporter permease n=1 Tax=Paenibacillus chartarius TaxID=747481 RepID=A0ABV6DKX0_9BACL